MRIQKFANNLAIQDDQDQIIHFVPIENLYVHLHPTNNNAVLLSSSSRHQSTKNAITIDANQVDFVGNLPFASGRQVLLIYLSFLLDDTKSLLQTYLNIDGFDVLHFMNTPSPYALELPDYQNEQYHILNVLPHMNGHFLIEDMPDDNMNFRLTNVSTGYMKLINNNGEDNLIYKGNAATEQSFAPGITVDITYTIDDNTFTITELIV